MTHRIMTAADTIGNTVDAEHGLAYALAPTGDGSGLINGEVSYVLPERLLTDSAYEPIHAALAAIPHRILFDSTLTDGQVLEDVWYGVYGPDIDGVPVPGRFTVATAANSPGQADPRSPGTATMRIELRDGDRQSSTGLPTSRAECFDRHPTSFASNVGQAKWPDPPGCRRVYMLKIYLPADFVVGDSTVWRVLSQWKGFFGGSPPLALEVFGSNWRIASPQNGYINITPIDLGAWTNLVLDITHNANPAIGRLTVYKNGNVVMGEHARSTMEATGSSVMNGTDPTYWKVGLYRSTAITATDIIHHGPAKMAYTIEAADDAGYME